MAGALFRPRPPLPRSNATARKSCLRVLVNKLFEIRLLRVLKAAVQERFDAQILSSQWRMLKRKYTHEKPGTMSKPFITSCFDAQAASLVSLLGGLVSDWLHKSQGWSLVKVRRFCQDLATLGNFHSYRRASDFQIVFVSIHPQCVTDLGPDSLLCTFNVPLHPVIDCAVGLPHLCLYAMNASTCL